MKHIACLLKEKQSVFLVKQLITDRLPRITQTASVEAGPISVYLFKADWHFKKIKSEL